MKKLVQSLALSITILLTLISSQVLAEEITVRVYTTNNPYPIGQVILRDTKDGLLLEPTLRMLPPGKHGFHIHQNPDCSNLGMSAGGHFDPQETDTHQGPHGKGHLGDLPVLIVDNAGNADAAMLAPRLKVSQIRERALVIHQGADTYSDKPPLGGGGARIACGVIH